AALLRGAHGPDRTPVLVRALTGEPPSAREVAKLQHEYAILRELDPLEGVVRPWGLEDAEGRAALLMRDPGGRPLRSLLSAGGGPGRGGAPDRRPGGRDPRIHA